MDPSVEAELVRRLRSGDTTAFDEIYDAYQRRLFRFLYRMARNRATAEDLAEEAWMRLVASAPALQQDTRLGPWLFTVARNLYVSYCRSRSREEAYTSEASLWPGELSPSPFALTRLHRLEEKLEAALVDLPPLYREALLLVGVEGWTPNEAAAICGVSPETLRQRLSRARAMLAKRIPAEERSEVTG